MWKDTPLNMSAQKQPDNDGSCAEQDQLPFRPQLH